MWSLWSLKPILWYRYVMWPKSDVGETNKNVLWNLNFTVEKFTWILFYSEKAMAPYSSTLAWKIPWMEEAGRLQSMGLLRVGYDWVTSLSLFTFLHWRRKLQPTPVFLPGESQGRGSLVGCRLWSHTESDTTEATWQQQQQHYSIFNISQLNLFTTLWLGFFVC